MTNIYEFMSGNPVLTFFLAVGLGIILETMWNYLINRPLRHWNIRKHGWPPAHCDADGDFKSEPEKDD